MYIGAGRPTSFESTKQQCTLLLQLAGDRCFYIISSTISLPLFNYNGMPALVLESITPFGHAWHAINVYMLQSMMCTKSTTTNCILTI